MLDNIVHLIICQSLRIKQVAVVNSVPSGKQCLDYYSLYPKYYRAVLVGRP